MEQFRSRGGEVRVAATSGHVAVIGKEWVEVPECLVKEAMAMGCIPKSLYEEALAEAKNQVNQDEDKEDGQQDNPPEGDANPEPAGADRKEQVLKALKTVMEMVEAGKTETEEGNKLVHNDRPLVAAVSEIAGFKVSGAEIDEALE